MSIRQSAKSHPVTKRVGFHTLGCKLNFAETSTIKRRFQNASIGLDSADKGFAASDSADSDYDRTGNRSLPPGMKPRTTSPQTVKFKTASFNSVCDIYVIHTCSVTADANRDCRKAVRKAIRLNPEAYIVVTGCYAQLEPGEVAAIEGVDLVVGTRDKFDLVELAGNFKKAGQPVIHHSHVNEAVDFHHSFSSGDRTRAFLKIQDGCDYQCSFCTIPLARGKSRSPSTTEILKQAGMAVSQPGRPEIKEMVLTGVNTGDFGRQTNETFLDLIRELDKYAASRQLGSLERIRISSLEPNLLSEEIIDFIAESSIFQPHFHIPLQSGSDTMLRLMKRRYLTSLFRERIDYIRSVIPHACIGADVITGHPGETEKLFRTSLSFIEELDISYLHVFTYSERPGTSALSIPGNIDHEQRKQRTDLLRRLSDRKRFEYQSRFLETRRPVLFEQNSSKKLTFGWSDNYIRVAVARDPGLTGRIVPCKLMKPRHDDPLVMSAEIEP